MADRQKQQSKRALWVAFALVATYLVIPDTAGAATFTTTITCTRQNACGPPTQSSGTPGGSAAVTAVFNGGSAQGMFFGATASGGATITNVVATRNDAAVVNNADVPPNYVYPLSGTLYIATFVVSWNDDNAT